MTSELIESWVPFRCRDGFDMRAWWARPATSSALPGILFVYEPFGINPEMKRVASELASEGYIVMIPDLMQRGSFFGCIRRLMADLKAEKGRGIDDLLDARQALVCRPDVLADRVAVMGLCMGGGFALILAKTGLFRVSAPFYGGAPVTLDGACPIVASYGGRDRVTAKDANHLAQELKRLAIDVAQRKLAQGARRKPAHEKICDGMNVLPMCGRRQPTKLDEVPRYALAFTMWSS